GLAAVVAIHELAEVVVIANGVRAGRRRAFADTAAAPQADEPTSQKPPEAQVAAGACADGCCGAEAPAITTVDATP
ncbi:MAG: hypothetical protein ACRD1D_16140, partial [Acidimicrobiales bacterium]